MEILKGNWTLGEVVLLPYKGETVKQNGSKIYGYELPADLFCLREATDSRKGILVKPLGKYDTNHILIVNKASFCKDKKLLGFNNVTYYSFPFPTVSELKEVLAVVRSDAAVQQMLRNRKPPIPPSVTYWVSDTRRCFPIGRRAQYYDPKTDSLHIAKRNEAHYRLTVAYFEREK